MWDTRRRGKSEMAISLIRFAALTGRAVTIMTTDQASTIAGVHRRLPDALCETLGDWGVRARLRASDEAMA